MTSLLDLALPYQKKVILDNSKVKILNFSRQIGKSWTAAYLATQKCLMKKNGLVIYLSTGQRAADESLKTCKKFGDATSKVLSQIGINSYGIYIFHQLFINIIYKLLKFDFIRIYPLIGFCIYLVIIFMLSYFTTYILRKIKLISKYVI